jgi:transposase
MGEQIHKRLTDEQMKMIVEKYLAKELSAAEAMELLCLKRRQFFEWVQKYRNDPERFTMAYRRTESSRKLDEATHAHILSELAIEKALVDDPSIPVRFYNYSYIKGQLKKNYQEKVSPPAIIDRAKKTAFTFPNRRGSSMTER